MTNYSSYLVTVTSTTSNSTSYCTTYTSSIYHPPWMAYTEIAAIYVIPLTCISIGILYLLYILCQKRPSGLKFEEKRAYREQRQMTWHVFLLSITFMFLWLPWISIRILIIFDNITTIQRILQITYYILILKSVLFPILYASTNAAFRGSFALYRHHRITLNNRVWTVDTNAAYTVQRFRGY
jgi:hypothetical protein